MQLNNPFKLNDWNIKSYFILVLSFSLMILGLRSLSFMGLDIPVIYELVSFIFIMFIPGFTLLRVLKIHQIGSIESLLYAVGLSITSLMILGLGINTVLPMLGLNNPLSFTNIFFSIIIMIFIFCVTSYIRDRDFNVTPKIEIKEPLTVIFLCTIPFLAILGAYLMNTYQINYLNLFLIFIIAILIILPVFDKISKNLYPLTIFVVSITLLLNKSLISMYLTGWDINNEFYLANLVITNFRWDPSLAMQTNSMLSIVMLAPFLSNFCKLDLIWTFKIIYPFIYSIVPLGMYALFKNQTGKKVAFLSSLFFIAIFTFHAEMISLARQETAEFFLILLMLLILTDEIQGINKSFLCILFAFSLIVSHYGLTYIFLIFLIIISILLYLNPTKLNKNIKISFLRDYQSEIISITFLLFFVVLLLSWYIYSANSSPFNAILNLGNSIITNINDLMNPSTSQGLTLLQTKSVSIFHTIAKYVHLISQALIGLGLLYLLFSKIEGIKFKKEFLIFAYISFIFLALSIVMPYVGGALNVNRLYHVMIIFLAPFFVIGGIVLLNLMKDLFRLKFSLKNFNIKRSLKIISVFLVIFLLFNTDFVYSIAKDNPHSISLTNATDDAIFNEKEVSASKWFHNEKSDNKIFADVYRTLLISELDWYQIVLMFEDYNLKKGQYVFLGSNNILNNTIVVPVKMKKTSVNYYKYISVDRFIINQSEIYNNGGAQIYIYQ